MKNLLRAWKWSGIIVPGITGGLFIWLSVNDNSILMSLAGTTVVSVGVLLLIALGYGICAFFSENPGRILYSSLIMMMTFVAGIAGLSAIMAFMTGKDIVSISIPIGVGVALTLFTAETMKEKNGLPLWMRIALSTPLLVGTIAGILYVVHRLFQQRNVTV